MKPTREHNVTAKVGIIITRPVLPTATVMTRARSVSQTTMTRRVIDIVIANVTMIAIVTVIEDDEGMMIIIRRTANVTVLTVMTTSICDAAAIIVIIMGDTDTKTTAIVVGQVAITAEGTGAAVTTATNIAATTDQIVVEIMKITGILRCLRHSHASGTIHIVESNRTNKNNANYMKIG